MIIHKYVFILQKTYKTFHKNSLPHTEIIKIGNNNIN